MHGITAPIWERGANTLDLRWVVGGWPRDSLCAAMLPLLLGNAPFRNDNTPTNGGEMELGVGDDADADDDVYDC